MRILRTPALFGTVCVLVGVAAAIGMLAAYLYFGNVPVAVADAPFPLEGKLAHAALEHRLSRQVESAPFQGTEADLVAGAHIYSQHCSVCHGVPGTKVALGAEMFPHAPQLWTSHRPGVVGVSDDPAGETFWKVKNGIRLSGMPAFNDALSTREMWQVSLLLSVADQEMKPAVASALQSKEPESK